MSEEILIQDLSAESLMVGAIVNNPTILDEYMTLISPDYDFSDSTLRMLYNLFVKAYMGNTTVNETSINLELAKTTEEEQQTYKKAGGYKVYQRLANIAKVQEDFQKIYEKVKTYNVLRYLDDRGFAVRKNIDKLKDKTMDQIIKIFELQLAKTAGFVKGIDDGVRVGDNIKEFYQRLLETPDEGLDMGYPIINYLIRGLRLTTIGGIGLNSGFGKSRTMARMLVYTSVINQTPIVILSNETNLDEFNLMVMTCVANMVFSKKYGCEVDEEEIARGNLSEKQKAMVKDAVNYINERSKIIFHEASIWDLSSLKMLMRKYQLRDKANYFIVDTFKPYHAPGQEGLLEWQQFTLTCEAMKEFAKQMKISIMFTFQLIDAVLQTGELNSNSISNGKHILHHMDFVILARQIRYKEKEKYQIKLEQKDNPFNGELLDFDIKKDYYIYKVYKNRAGKSNVDVVLEVSKGKMKFEELGYLVRKKEEN